MEYRKKLKNISFSEIYEANYGRIEENIEEEEIVNEEECEIPQRERQIFENIKACTKFLNWSLVYIVSIHLAFIFVLFSCFLRPDFFNVNFLFKNPNLEL